MTDKAELEQAFIRLAEALTNAPSPKPHGTGARWTRAAVRTAAISRERGKWDALSARPPGAAEATRKLDAASDAVDQANYGSAASVGSALGKVEGALSEVETVLR